MKFALALTTNLGTEQNSWINNLSNRIEEYFGDKYYGKDLKQLYVGLICVKPQFELFFKPRELKYQKGKRTNVSDGIEVAIEDCIQYELKLDYEDLSEMDEHATVEKIAEVLLSSINCLSDLKKLKDFNYNGFREDLQKVIGRKELL